jgi:hypothetical protein
MPFVVTPKESEYGATQLLVGKSYKIYLSNSSALTVDSTSAQWSATELAASNGYAAVTGTIAAGSYNSTLKQFETAQINGIFTATAGGSGIVFRAVIIELTGGATRTHPYAVNIYPANQTITAGTSRAFGLQLSTRALETF